MEEWEAFVLVYEMHVDVTLAAVLKAELPAEEERPDLGERKPKPNLLSSSDRLLLA